MRNDDKVKNLRADVKKGLDELDATIHRAQRVADRNRWYIMGEDEIVLLALRLVHTVEQLKLLDKGCEQITHQIAFDSVSK
jgi:hypothetical protein